jgi:hypothetical protein
MLAKKGAPRPPHCDGAGVGRAPTTVRHALAIEREREIVRISPTGVLGASRRVVGAALARPAQAWAAGQLVRRRRPLVRKRASGAERAARLVRSLSRAAGADPVQSASHRTALREGSRATRCGERASEPALSQATRAGPTSAPAIFSRRTIFLWSACCAMLSAVLPSCAPSRSRQRTRIAWPRPPAGTHSVLCVDIRAEPHELGGRGGVTEHRGGHQGGQAVLRRGRQV